MSNIEKTNNDYRQWLIDLKSKIRQSQIKAAVRVNEELLRLYWKMGQDIVVRQMEATWGSKFFEKLSKDLRSEFPYMKGLSPLNLYRMKRFYLFYTETSPQVEAEPKKAILSQLATKLQVLDNKRNIILSQLATEFESHPIFQIPWGHH